MTFRSRNSAWLVLVALLASPVHARGRPSPAAAAAHAAAHDAAVVARQAKGYFGQRKFDLAAELYGRAYQLNPSRPEYLYGVGRAEQMAGRVHEARSALETLQKLLPAGHPLQAKASAALAQLRAAEPPPVVPTPPPPPPTEVALPVAVSPAAAPTPTAASLPAPPTPVVAARPPPPPPSVSLTAPPPQHLMTQAAMWTGGAAILTGIGLAIGAEVMRSQLVDDLGVIRGTEAADRQRTINALSTASLIAVAAGAGGLALGLYWRIGEAAEGARGPVVSVGPSSVGVSWRF